MIGQKATLYSPVGTAGNLTISEGIVLDMMLGKLLIYYIDSEHNLGAALMAISQAIKDGLNGRHSRVLLKSRWKNLPFTFKHC